MLVVDDHAGFREMARALAVSGGLEVVAEAADGESALILFERHHPDLVLLDIGLPDIDGFDVRRRLLQRSDPPVVLLTSSRGASAYGARLFDPARIPFVPKDELSVAALVDLLPPD